MTATAPITFAGDRMSVNFDRFGIAEYDLFLRAKRLPESQTIFRPETETYSIEAPARFASMLGVDTPDYLAGDLPLPKFLFDDQQAVIDTALAAKRFAVWSDCGLGKTLVMLEFARQVIHRTGGRVLIITLNEIVAQTIQECQKFYGDSLPIKRLASRQDMRDWCKNGSDDGCMLAITNYEKMNPDGLDDQVVPEMKHLAGIILDESSRLKTGGGKQKWAIIKSCKGIEYKLSCTATPAPNDTMEFASQASFLEKMRSEGEIIWTYFARDPKSHRWAVKKHARKAFFEFMSAWSIYIRDPKKYGWRLGMAEVPPPAIQVHELPITPEQQGWLQKLSTDPSGQRSLFQERDTNAIQRSKLSQVAKGFRYRKGEQGKFDRINSPKPQFIADLISQEVAAGLQVLVWTVFDAESTILAEALTKLSTAVPFKLLTGKTDAFDRLNILERFRGGDCPVLISRAAMLGYGMNFQFCGSMIFSGWSDSYEQYYQAVRRAVRYGQTKSVRVHLPVIPDLEGDMLDNVFRKQADHEAAIREMEENYIAARRALEQVA